MLFGVQLGGGTDIGGALGYCRRLITPARATPCSCSSATCSRAAIRPPLRRASPSWSRDGVHVLVLLALSDDGVPAHDHHEAEALTALGATVTACTPDEFPDVLAAAL